MNRPRPDAIPSGWLALPQRRPGLVLGAALLIVAFAILLIRTIPADGSLESMLPRGDSSSAALGNISKDFDLAQDATLLVSMPEDEASDPAKLLGFAQRFDRAMQDEQDSQTSLGAVVYHWPGDGEAWARNIVTPNLALYLDAEGQAALTQRLTPTGMAEQFRMNERAAAAPGVSGSVLAPLLKDPLRLREFVGSVFDGLSGAGGAKPGEPMLSADGRSILIRVTPNDRAHDSATARRVMSAVRRSLEKAEPGDLEVSIGGGLAIAETAERSIRSDMIASSIGTVVFLQLLFLLTYRRLLLFPIAFLPAVVGVLVGFGVFALMGRALSPPTAVLGALLAGLGIDYAIHYLSHIGRGEPLHAVSRRLAFPLGMACVTSIIAFLTLVLSDVSAVRDFATIAVIGLAATWVTTLLLLPALLNLLGRRGGDGASGEAAPVAAPRWRFERCTHLAVKHQRLGLALSGACLIASVLVLLLHPQGPVRFDSDLGNMHPQPNAALDTQHAIAEAFPGRGEAMMLYLVAPSEQELLRRAERCKNALAEDDRADAVVAATYGLDRLIPSQATRDSRRAFVAAIDVERVLADFDAAVQASIFRPQAFADYRTVLTDLLRPGAGPTLETLADYPGLTQGMLPGKSNTVKTDASDSTWQAVTWVFVDRALTTRAERSDAIHAIRSALGDVPGATLTGMTVVGHDVESEVRSDLPLFLGIAACVVALWLGLCFRHVGDTVLALLPVTIGLCLTFAAMLIGGIGLNLLNLVALPLLAGLGIDDGVFMVAIARDARRRRVGRNELIRQLSVSAQAVTLTSATTALAFGSLVWTGVPAIRSLGIVMAIGIVACWGVTVIALTPLIVRADLRRTTAAGDEGGAAS